MNGIENIEKGCVEFRELLETRSSENSDAEFMLTLLKPLFDEIASGLVVPPKHYDYRLALGKDSRFYDPNEPYSSAEASFVAALEDWESQAWYREGRRR